MIGAGNASAERFARRWGWAVITLAVLITYWPLSSFHYALGGGDALDCWLPWRWFIASSLQTGHTPLWNPLQQMGYPIYADLQGPAWYVEALALGGTVGHSIFTLQALYLLYIIVGGIGFMRLARTVHDDARAALITGCAYALSGSFTAHQMHFYSVVSGAWMPWLLAAQLRLMRAPHWRSATEAAVFQSLLITGGNHTFTIIGAYLLLTFCIAFMTRAMRLGGRAGAGQLVRMQSLFVTLTVLMSCGTLFAWWEVRPFLDRASGLDYSAAMDGPFTWRAARSLLMPFTNGEDKNMLGTDPTMANGYMGVLVLVFASLALLRKRSAIENILLGFGAVCALASFGAALPVHKWLWAFAPGMDLFRFPSYFGWFTMIAALPLAVGSLRDDAVWNVPRKRALIALLLMLLTVVCVWMLRAWSMRMWEPSFRSSAPLFDRLREMGHAHRVLLSGAVPILALLAALLLAWRDRLSLGWVLALVLAEMMWNTHLAQWGTAVSDLHPAALASRMERCGQGPIVPDQRPMGSDKDRGDALHFLWRNTEDIEGRPTHDGFNSFWLRDAIALETKNTGLWSAMKRQPLVYLSDRVVRACDRDPLSIDPAKDSALIVLPDDARRPVGLRCSPEDLIAFTSFDFSGFGLKARTGASTFLLVQQSWYPGWRIRIDGRPVTVQRANIAAFGAVLPAGTHQVEVRFEKPIVHWLLAVSLITFLISVTVLTINLHGHQRVFAWIGTALLAEMLAWSLFGHPAEQARHGSGEAWMARVPDAPDDRVCHREAFDAPIALTKDHPYTPAFRTSADSLRSRCARAFVIDLRYRSGAGAKCRLVIERKRDGRTVDYEAVPFGERPARDTGWTAASVVRDIRELRHNGEELGIYLWNDGADTLRVGDIRLRSVQSGPIPR